MTNDQILRSYSLKVTPIRVAVLEYLHDTKTPVDVAEIEDYLAHMKIEANTSTVYRILLNFTELGLTKRIEFLEGKARYELASLPHHHHIICKKCGLVADIENCDLSYLEKDITTKTSFAVQSHNLEFFGLCEVCNVS